MVTNQLLNQLLGVQAIGLGSSVPTTHFDARRIDHDIIDPTLQQNPVDPETIATRFVATPYRSVGRQAESFLGLRDAIGLALPGMPSDSPGMGGDESTWESQPVMLVNHDGSMISFSY